MFNGSMSLLDLQQRFRTNQDCIEYLHELKWSDGFCCRKCLSTKCRRGNTSMDKRCKRCGYHESVTAGTLFHKIKFSLLKSFHICMKINNYSAEQIGELLEKHVSKEASIRTDCWTAYEKLGKDWNIKQELSEKGKNFREMHILIMNFKTWLRGIHHKCSEKHMQAYLNEFFFRFNRRGFVKSIFSKLMERMVSHAPIYHKDFAT